MLPERLSPSVRALLLSLLTLAEKVLHGAVCIIEEFDKCTCA